MSSRRKSPVLCHRLVWSHPTRRSAAGSGFDGLDVRRDNRVTPGNLASDLQ